MGNALARAAKPRRHQFPRLWPVALPIVDTALPPLTPAAYLKLRREAAGLSIAQVAERLEPRIALRRDVATILDMLERPGATARTVSTLRPLKTVFAIDLEVYAQLRDEPATRHPSICRGCGCSQSDPCVIRERGSHLDTCCTLRQHSCDRCVPDMGDVA